MRKHNFYAGPSTLPLPVLEEMKENLVDYHGMGLSLIETSHRSKEYDEVHEAALAGLREHLQVPESHQILLVGGGATMQFAMVPMNLMAEGGSADIVVSGSWAKKALGDLKLFGTANVIFDGSQSSYTTLPDAGSLTPSSGASYLHITSNETIQGVQWKSFPVTGDVPLVADMSSDILSRPIDVSQFGLIYAGAQKNMGPAGVTVVIVSRELVEKMPDRPAYLSYKVHAEKNSLYNTPPVFAVYALSLVMKWIGSEGGVAAVAARNREKASLVYGVIDEMSGFYSCPVATEVRSPMNVVFRLQSEELEKQFVSESAELGMLGLKGHRSVGGIRASLYNALPLESAKALAEFMRDFAQRNG
jgi:phosphoserine aminotransferase